VIRGGSDPEREQKDGEGRQRTAGIPEGIQSWAAMLDHMRKCLSAPPKFSIAMAIGRLKGKSAIRTRKELPGREPKGLANKNVWARGCCASAVGLDGKQIREYIQNHEKMEAGEQGYLNF
jgi:putative transposase